MTRRVVALATLLLTLSLTATPALARPPADVVPAAPELVDGTETDDPGFVVQLNPDVTDDERGEVLADRGLELVDEAGDSDFVLARPSGGPSDLQASGAAPSDAVVGIEPVVPMRASAAPNDFHYPFQWHLPMIQAPRAWDVGSGQGAVVAVLDTGVAYRNHPPHKRAPDLAAVRFTRPRDIVDDDAYPDDPNGHGTHVTGSIAQSTGNGIGAAGLAHGATIMPIRVLDEEGMGNDYLAAKGLRWAADNGANVANLSFGGEEHSAVLADAVSYAIGKGVVVVAATGNEARTGAPVGYPAALPGTIAVGAVRADETWATYSSYGPEVDLVAPGGDMTRDDNGDDQPDGILQQTLDIGGPGTFRYTYMHGTSMAAPQVAAAAALLVAEGTTDPVSVRAALVESARDLGVTGRDDRYGHGLLQARAALDLVGARPQPDFVPGASPRSIDDGCPIDRVFRGRFTDVPHADLHGRAIDCVAWWGISTGTTLSTYAPGSTVTRAQMATFIGRTINEIDPVRLPLSPPNAFTDDDGAAHRPHHVWINRLAAVGIVKGTRAGRYDPDAPVSREALATFLVRAHDHLASPDLAPSGPYFSDNTSPTHGGNVDKAASVGLTSGTAPGRYSPGLSLRRNQMASFLARLVDLFDDRGIVVTQA